MAGRAKAMAVCGVQTVDCVIASVRASVKGLAGVDLWSLICCRRARALLQSARAGRAMWQDRWRLAALNDPAPGRGPEQRGADDRDDDAQ